MMDVARRFGEAVRQEMRATWGSYWPHWVVLALVVEVLLVGGALSFDPASLRRGVRSVPGLALPVPAIPLHVAVQFAVGYLACFLPTWLCADLLALRFKGNPDPHREWHPLEFLARAMGRLAPCYAALVLWTVSEGAINLASSGPDPYFAPRRSMLASGAGIELVLQWLPRYAASVLASGLPYAALAALFSATTRRPRRWVVAGLTLLALNLCLAGGMYAMTSAWDSDPMHALSAGLLVPPHLTLEVLLFRFGPPDALPEEVWTQAAGYWTCAAGALVAVTWLLTLRRLDRHPNSATPDPGTHPRLEEPR